MPSPPEVSVGPPEDLAPAAHAGVRSTKRWDPVVVAILGAVCVYVAWLVDRGWIPHDDGLLAQAAERVLLGERPHIDFQDPYTGVLSYWHALSFRLFGVHLLSLRVMLYLCFLPFLAATFALARRFVGRRWAALAAAAAAVWGVPNYPASMPTWYNLFFAVVALLAFARFLESGRHVWLAGAGAAAGASTLFKLVGVFSLAGLLLALFLCSPWVGEGPEGGRDRSPWASGLASAGALTYAVLLSMLVLGNLGGEMTAAHVFHYLLPGFCLAVGAGATVWLAPWRGGGRSSDVALLLRRVLALAGGFVLPIVLFTLPYAMTGGLSDLWQGVVVLPQRRFAFASGAPFPLRRLLPSLPVLLLAGAAVRAPRRWREGAFWVLAALLGSILLLGRADAVFGPTWYALRSLPTLAVVVGLITLARRFPGRMPAGGGAPSGPPVLMAAAVFAMLGTFSMVQFPFTGPVYYFYVAPLLPVAAAALFALCTPPARRLVTMVLVFSTFFGVAWVNHASILGLGAGRFVARDDVERLRVGRGRIRVTAEDRAVYEELVATVQAVTRSGFIFATPDAPEVYFLTGLRNPTPVFYDFFADEEGRTDRTLEALDREDVNVVVLNTGLRFSPPPPPSLIEALEARYHSARRVGPFIVRWN